MHNREIRRLLKQSQSIVEGQVTLSSGLESSYYMDAKRFLFHPECAEWATSHVLSQLYRWGVRDVAGVPDGGALMAAQAVAYSYSQGTQDGDFNNEYHVVRGFYIRKYPKPHGTGKLLEGSVPSIGTEVVVLEDVVTTGASVLGIVERLRGAGLVVSKVLALADRQDGGGRKAIEGAGCEFTALIDLYEVLTEETE